MSIFLADSMPNYRKPTPFGEEKSDIRNVLLKPVGDVGAQLNQANLTE